MPIKPTLESRMQYRIKRGKNSTYLPSDFFDLSDRDQVGRVLRSFVKKKFLVKLGPGVYARTKTSKIKSEPVPEKDLRSLAIEALEKLGVKVVPSRYDKEYAKGKTTQVPTGRVIGVVGRVSRTIGYNGKYIQYEHHTKP